MKSNLRFVVSAVVVTLGLFLCAEPPLNYFGAAAQSSEQKSINQREEAYRANNLGIAQLEQFNYKEGSEAFRRALALDPHLKIARINLAIALFNAQEVDPALIEAKAAARIAPESPQPAYILGLIAKNQNRTDEAITSFQKVLAIDARDVGANVNLGQIYIQQRKYAEAITAFRKAIDAEPYNSTALYNLATALLRGGERAEGQQLMSRFQTLRRSGAATSIGQNYLEQGRYAEAIVSTGAESELVDKTGATVVFQNSSGVLLAQRRQPGIHASGFGSLGTKSKYEILQSLAGGAALFDFDGDGDLDLAKLNNSTSKLSRTNLTLNAAGSVSLFRNDKGKFIDVSKTSGDLAKIVEKVSTGIIAGDFDNDGLPDLFVTEYDGLRLFRNAGRGKFIDVSVQAKLPSYPSLSISSAFVDADHDGDLDIFIAGFANLAANDASLAGNFAPAPHLLLRNNGDGTFIDISGSAQINSSKAENEKSGNAIAVIPTDFDNRRDVDLLVLNYKGAPNLYRNLRDGSFRDVANEVGLNQTAEWTCAAIGDFNKDSFVDFFFGRANSVGVFAVSDGRGKFVMRDGPTGTENTASAQFLDYDNDGLLDLIANTEKGFVVFRNLGERWGKANGDAFKIKTDFVNGLLGSRHIIAGDVDSDGDEDLFALARNGVLHYLVNAGGNKNESQTIRLGGRNSNRTGIGAKIDMRSGSLTQKLETYSASPAPAPSDVQFGLGKRKRPDAVRVVWPSGVVQAEVEFPAQAKNTAALKIEELDRKPSSCPYLYTWNGERFEFITDFLGGGEMGNWASAGAYHYPDSNEFVRIAPEKLKPKNGRYEIRVTNELEEVLFMDLLKLVAVEHDADAEVYPNEGLGIPTAGERILYTAHGEQAPISAVDSKGQNVLPQIENLDRKFYDSFKPLNIRGYAAEHNLTLNLDEKKDYKGRTLLLLTGWTDYAFSSDNLAASQSGRWLFLPKLQVKNRLG
ncbi:MAG: FG-GAP-like repeat-containing protein, partial [Pyrinomonadaceae bacterium]